MLSKSERTEILIIEKAAELFNRNGFYGTSLADITSATGLTKGAIYGHFSCKEEIGLLAFEYNTTKLLKGFKSYIGKRHTLHEQIGAFFEYYKDHYLELTKNGGCPFMNSTIEFDDQPGKIQEKIKGSYSQWMELFIVILSEAQIRKEIKTDLNFEKYALLFVSMIEGALLFTHLTRSPKALTFAFEQINSIVNKEIAK